MDATTMDATPSLWQLTRQLRLVPGLLENLSIPGLFQYLRHAARLKDDLALTQNAAYNILTAPEFIPELAHNFLAHVAGVPLELAQDCWTALGSLAWSLAVTKPLESSVEDSFLEHGVKHGISTFCLNAPKCP